MAKRKYSDKEVIIRRDSERKGSRPMTFPDETLVFFRDFSISWLNSLPKHKSIAKEQGSKYYFTPQLCVEQHIAPRNTYSGRCVVCDAKERLRHYLQHRDQLIAKGVENNRRRYATSPAHKARRKARAMVERVLKAVTKKKEKCSVDHLLFSYEEFEKFIVERIPDGMSILDTGLWELDHIIPVALFNEDLPDVEKVINSLENLQILPVEVHRRKTLVDVSLINDVKRGRIPNPADDFYKEVCSKYNL